MNSHPSKRLHGQRAIVTGACSGIGASIATALAEAGAAVVVNYPRVRERGDAEAIVDKILAKEERAIAVEADVSQEQAVEQMFRIAIETLGSVDILVNNAGIQNDASFVDMSLEQWNLVIGVNLTGQFLCARAAAAWSTPKAERELLELIPYKRVGLPEDIGACAAWLASDDADYIHGATLYVDGGMLLYPGFATGG